MIDELIDVDIKILEDIFEKKHCEVMHDRPGIARWCAPCSHQVVATLEHICSGRSGYVCQSVVDSAHSTGLSVVCKNCRLPILDCWIFEPYAG